MNFEKKLLIWRSPGDALRKFGLEGLKSYGKPENFNTASTSHVIL